MEGYKVYTFEPVSMNVEILELNKKENNCTNMTIVPKALSNFNGTKKIYVPYCSDNTSFDLSVAVSNMKNKNYIEENVECITFDTWLDENENPDVGFIKIDVQGFEKEVLEGMRNFLSSFNDLYIFLEWDEKHTKQAGSSIEEIEQILTSNGFRMVQDFRGDKLFYKN
jgi:FkbM family methyltransferase